MFTQNKEFMDTMFSRFRQATETNLKLQQDLLQGWTRYWPGFTARPVGPTGENRLINQWSEGMLRISEAQRDFIGQQYDVVRDALNTLATMGENGAATAEQPTSVAPVATKAAPAPAPTAEAPATPKAEAVKAEVKAEVKAPVAKPEPKPTPVAEPRPVGIARRYDHIKNQVAIITGAASGIGEAVSKELAARGAKAVLLVDRSEAVAELAKLINKETGREVAVAKVGDTTDEAFRKRVFNDAAENYGQVSICVPAAGITRDALSVRINKETGKAEIYPTETFRQVMNVNLVAPIYWGIEMVARIAEDRKQRGLKRWEPAEEIQGTVVFLGSVSSQGNKGQISYAVAKAGLEGAAATLTKEAIFHGVRCGVIHPGFTDTPMARALGQDFLDKYVLPYTQLRRLIHPEEIADAICFMINNSAVSGELWADAGWHPPA